MKLCSDGGYILGGQSTSNTSGDKTEDSFGNYDYWLVKTDSLGNIQWQKTIGGSSADEFYSIEECQQGGYILGGKSSSDISGNKTENSNGGTDYWVVRVDGTGNIIWQNTIGGSNTDELKSVYPCTDGGFILGGHSSSPASGDKTEDFVGGYDFWIVKLDSIGNISWQNTIGGNGQDWVQDIQQCSDGGYIIGGYSNSSAVGDKTEDAIGSNDYWIVKLNSSGLIDWQNTIGGSQWDELTSIEQCTDGGYIIGGFSWSNVSGDKTEDSNGNYDYWVIKLNETGTIEWQNTIGGSSSDKLYSVSQCTDGGYIIGGRSNSNSSGDKAEDNNGGDDYWVLKLNYNGYIIWQRTIGGTGIDILNSVMQSSDGGYLLGGQSASYISGDKTENSNGGIDYWPIKLLPDPEGCTNPLACNYNFSATTDDGSCLIIGDFCDDGIPCNVNETIHSFCNCIGEPLFLGDFNLDCAVDTSDLLAFLSVFGCDNDCGYGDFNGDGNINTSDLLMLLSWF